MKRRTLAVTASLAVVAILAVPETKQPTEAEIVAQLPKEVRVLLPGGLCDSIHTAFLLEVERFPEASNANRAAIQERIEYYRAWLRRKGCG